LIYAFGDRVPELHGPSCYICPSAQVIGSVRLGENASIWFNAVLRGDSEWIDVGANSNVQDGSVVHADPGMPTVIGSGVSIGHMVLLHGCRVDANSLIGNGAIVLDGARIGTNCVVAAGALVTPRTVIPDGVVVMGSPARVVREATARDLEMIAQAGAHYVQRGAEFRRGLHPIADLGLCQKNG
jgi:carbonic anhydrase/acetyltransferase-like protein (isoleucine patch superfamily)